jgi:hypothetical protein
MTGSVQPYCEGKACPIKHECCRYKAVIDFKHENHFPYSPYNGATNKCGFFVGDTNKTFLENLKSMKDGRTENNSLRED